jgi:intracellular multiplication protein IcmT
VPIFPGLGVSPYTFLPLLIWMFSWSWTTLYIALCTMAASVLLAKMGYTYKRMSALVKHKLRGPRIYARPWWHRKRYAPAGNRIGDRRSGLSYEHDSQGH